MIWFAAYVVLFLIFYKIIDYLIRIPRVGNYSGRYILVTGCDTGFGNLIAKRLDQLGCHVFAGCYTEKGETDLKKSCSDRLHVVSMDVSNHESIEKAFAYVEDKLPKGKGKQVRIWCYKIRSTVIFNDVENGSHKAFNIMHYSKSLKMKNWIYM